MPRSVPGLLVAFVVYVYAGDGGEWLRCKAVCGTPVGFQANSAEAHSLFRGCSRSDVYALSGSRQHGAAVIVAGSQKGGTTSFMLAANRWKWNVSLCMHRKGEAHFFGQLKWKNKPVTSSAMAQYFAGWSSCRATDILYEKTPAYLRTPWVPSRICEVWPQVKIVFLLRHPIHRAYSGFLQTTGRKAALASFTQLALTEVALVRQCGHSPQLHLGHDAAFTACCWRVVKAYRMDPNLVCTCSSDILDGDRCDPDAGHMYASPVRHSIYVHHLRFWFQRFRVSEMLFYKSEDFFERMEYAIPEIACFARPSTMCPGKARRVHVNSKRSKHPDMWNSTYNLLQDFFTPYNQELDVLLGRNILGGDGEANVGQRARPPAEIKHHTG
eukprot:CAMPEP_0117526712 /NCGR_PEP_ID=MMETSP0784-20121206/36425_1 /TAXON_ID=39447 /ORGANISM="" /LENGTH=382 /DNA_ID=CAMNT_0005322945 /DNA_START=39 /DNA_END=1185 /DNA_ORIENTATION=-